MPSDASSAGSDRQERHGDVQGVAVSSDESDHAECETLGITQTGDVTNMTVVTAKGIEACGSVK